MLKTLTYSPQQIIKIIVKAIMSDFKNILMSKVAKLGMIDIFQHSLSPFSSLDDQKIKEFNDSVEQLDRVVQHLDIRLAALHLNNKDG
jgi:hypothetical protein